MSYVPWTRRFKTVHANTPCWSCFSLWPWGKVGCYGRSEGYRGHTTTEAEAEHGFLQQAQKSYPTYPLGYPDWSPDGQKIVFTRHSVNDDHNNSVTAEIYVLNLETGNVTPLTSNSEEERAPAWSPTVTA